MQIQILPRMVRIDSTEGGGDWQRIEGDRQESEMVVWTVGDRSKQIYSWNEQNKDELTIDLRERVERASPQDIEQIRKQAREDEISQR